MEYETAGTMLALLGLPRDVLDVIVAAGWLDVPLHRWKDVIKPQLDLIRRVGMVGTLSHDGVYTLRKMINVTYRRDTEADWEKEKRNRTVRSFPKQTVCREVSYVQRHLRISSDYIRQTINRVVARNDSGDLAWWWKRRHHHIPGGSTSHGAATRAALKSDPRFGKGDRPGKKSMAELLTSDFYKTLMDYPPVNAARASTKYEPGDKRRALYASNEIPYLISAYASVHVEKEMVRGVCARQSVGDWAGWLQWACDFRGYHTSTDFSDYNSEHELIDLMIINLVRARAWLLTSAPERYEKARAHIWLSAAITFSWVEFPNETIRIFSGLYSGSRDTMRDHCDRHFADIRVAAEDARACGYNCMVREGDAWLAGDDEDVGFRSLSEAVVYANMLPMQGHNTNPSKQLAGARHNEFLQVMHHPGSTMQRPLPALVATMASGNWYVPTATWFDGLLSGVSDNAWEAYCRGLPFHAAFRLACAYLDTAMRVRTETGYRELEWWEYRSPGRVHPLWNEETKKAPLVRQYPAPHPEWPCNATNDWLETVERQLRDVPTRKVQLYREKLLQSSHGSAFLEWRQSDLRDMVLSDWPRRQKRTYRLHQLDGPAAFTVEQMNILYKRVGISSRPRDDAELAARLGVDPDIAQLQGSWGSLATRLRGPQWAAYSAPLPGHILSKRAAASAWAFRSWAARTAAPTADLHQGIHNMSTQFLIYIYAPNGAGKSWIVRKHPDWLDLDGVSAAICSQRLSYRRYAQAPSARDVFIHAALKRALRGVCSTVVLLGNYPVVHIQKAAANLGISFRGADYLPGWDLCRERLKKRGKEYTDQRIDELQRRWIPYTTNFKTLEELEHFISGST
jgi:hypothetical protein